MKKECVTMLLAGGVGKRLGLLTQNIAKPAVPFGGRYRIIDFTLSNCLNSRMYTVGVLTQYSPPLELHKHIGVGKPWDMDRMEDGLTILSPFTVNDGGSWYLGTADAITKNINYIEGYDPEYLIVLSGDHIYHMDYTKLLQQHKEKGADVTISAIEVPWEETSRFGILNTTDDLKIYQFEEKPMKAKNNLASMGIYIFNWKILKDYLEDDATNNNSNHDFGQDILPAMIENNLSLYAYRFEGYWKDVGTINSYWEAHMDLLEDHLPFSLNNDEWRIYSHDSNFSPQLIDKNTSIHHSLVNNGCVISGTIDHTVLFENVEIKKDAIVKESILLPGVRVGENAFLQRVIVQENVTIPANTRIIANSDSEPVVLSNENLESIS
ncbi:glucose-1-phosphate adenylyltransferase [Gracilibacillus boraciitolerans JCM 21714]|uniref:Glucose-1-phosphate adenylyltransferase n=1 Tax=Gracilibacillus boraciitolerans JCM 21714 TaxID=1298598 RepID=W4VIL9_9BACI|nr:glucose-1-phosphate adenylyltransferase [Gracilibacillus boraciitolerans]GAE92663.1 glucose-1-phosphate adenylyltransferase [Gracilibacillus boraciitolerans JCM 21714]